MKGSQPYFRPIEPPRHKIVCKGSKNIFAPKTSNTVARKKFLHFMRKFNIQEFVFL